MKRSTGLQTHPKPCCDTYGLRHRYGCAKFVAPERKPRTPLPRFSRKRAKENDEYYPWVRALMAERSGCEGREWLGIPLDGLACAGSHDPHHIKRTSQGGARMDPDNVLRLCRRHHDWVHNNITEAKALGLLRGAYE